MPTCRRTCVYLLLLLIAAPAARAADLLRAVPDGALGVVVINRLEETSDKLEKIATLVGAPSQSVLTLFRVQTGIHQGLDEKGTAALVILAPQVEGAAPQGIFLLPVNDYAKFLAQLQPDDATAPIASIRLAGKPMFVAKHGDFAALGDDTDKGALQALIDSKKDASGQFKPLAKWLEQIDIGAAATPAGVQYAVSSIKMFLPLARLSLGGLGGGQQQQNPQVQQAQQSLGTLLDTVEGLLDPLAANVGQFAVGLRIDDKSNVHLAKHVQFVEGGAWAKACTGAATLTDNGLAGLPNGPFGFASSMVFPKALRDALGGQIASLMKLNPAQAQLPADQQAAFVQAVTAMMAPLESGSMLMGVTKPDEPLYGRMVALTKVDDAVKYLDDYAKLIKAMEPALKNPQMQISYQIKKIDVDGVPTLDVLSDFGAMDPKAAASIKPMFQKMFGSADKVHFYLAAPDKKTLVMAYVSMDNLKRALAAAKANDKGLAGDSQIAQTAALFPQGPQLALYIQPRGVIEWFGGILSSVPAGPRGLQMPSLAELPTAPPLGIAVAASATGIDSELVAPADTLKVIGQIVAKFRNR